MLMKMVRNTSASNSTLIYSDIEIHIAVNRTKRPEMGRVAASHADFAYLTDEDPRLEDRDSIIAEIAAGAVEAGAREGEGFARIPDRREAVRAAIRAARRGDVVVLAGKGHETSIDGALSGRAHSVAWDEVGEAREALRIAGYGRPAAGKQVS